MLIELKNINFKRDKKQILKDISLKIDLGKFVVITGPNGSGKSTLAKIIMGIEKPDSGEIFLDGENITNLDINERAKKGISFAFQQPVRFKGLTVFDLLKISAGKNITKKEACEALYEVGLCAEEYVNRELNTSLSGGEAKRIEIAMVVLRKAKLTIFDEPEAGIDIWSFNNLIDIFKNMRNEVKGTTIIISHQERIINIADEIILIKNGKLAYVGTNKEKVFTHESKKCCKTGQCEVQI